MIDLESKEMRAPKSESLMIKICLRYADKLSSSHILYLIPDDCAVRWRHSCN